ncbi:hypothetical protein [Maribacter sp. 2210JD10-5]|uniref:hypothetical protein n=1 Tax=Maribacter sp. 2210JD10-5 TaxID=3386272 RepID=UPI0039BCBEE9
MEKLPLYIPIVFCLTVFLTLALFYWIVKNASVPKIRKKANLILLFLLAWIAVQEVLAAKGVFYENLEVLPPRIFLLGILPVITVMFLLFLTKTGKRFIDSLCIKKLTIIHLVRIPVEFTLLWLFQQKVIPIIMTFEGWNFDIIMGLTAPLIFYFGFKGKLLRRHFLLVWNGIGILFLAIIFIIAVLSAPFPLQQFAFDQPNVALLYFPYNLLPTFIVPVVVLSHFILIRKLIRLKPEDEKDL